MNIFFTIFIGMVGLITLMLIVALFIKKDYTIVRDITIAAPKQLVFDYIKHMKNQDKWSKWVMADPNVKLENKGTDGTVGFVVSWDSKNKQVGKGEQEIKKIVEGEQMDLEIRFIKPFDGIAKAYFKTESMGAQTKLTWSFSSSMKYPMNILMPIMGMEKMLGNDLAISLSNLKAILEKK